MGISARSGRSLARLGLASLLGALAGVAVTGTASADTAATAPSCAANAGNCAMGTLAADAPLKAEIKNALPTQIDSGWMDKGLIKIRTRFTIDPVKSDPLASIAMNKGALVQASWNEKGFVEVRPLTGEGAEGAMNIHYTLTPSLEASIYGIGINYNASQLLNRVQGASFNYDSKASKPFVPWGFEGAEVKMPAPALDQSTIFSIPFKDLGVSTGIVEGVLAIQASTAPTVKFLTKEVRFDSTVVNKKDGSAKIAVGDQDFLDVNATVAGELSFTGNLDVKPVVRIDTVSGYPTFGLTKFSFSVVSKPLGVAPMPISFLTTNIHIPLPNVKVPSAGVNLGAVKAGGQADKTVTIENTGEMEARFTVTSSDPAFSVSGGEVKIPAKSKADLKITFKSANAGPASSTITVKSNDPDSPEQSFKIGANGASVEDDSSDGASGDKKKPGTRDLDPLEEDSGCSTAAAGSGGAKGTAGLGLLLGLAMLARRRRASR